jgi:hypothetical protein
MPQAKAEGGSGHLALVRFDASFEPRIRSEATVACRPGSEIDLAQMNHAQKAKADVLHAAPAVVPAETPEPHIECSGLCWTGTKWDSHYLTWCGSCRDKVDH